MGNPYESAPPPPSETSPQVKPESVEVKISPESENKAAEKPEVKVKDLSEARLEEIRESIAADKEKMSQSQDVEKSTQNELNKLRKEMGLPPLDKLPPSVLAEKDREEKLQRGIEEKDKEKEAIEERARRENFVNNEKNRIFQEKIEELFKEFQKLAPEIMESLASTGKTPEGGMMQSGSMGSLNPESAKALAGAFKQGIKMIPKILEALPDLIKAFDEALEKEAENRYEQQKGQKNKDVGVGENKEKEGGAQEKTGEAGKPEAPKAESTPISAQEKSSVEQKA